MIPEAGRRKREAGGRKIPLGEVRPLSEGGQAIAVARQQRVGLHQVLQRIPHVHAEDARGEDTGNAGDDADERLNFIHAGQ